VPNQHSIEAEHQVCLWAHTGAPAPHVLRRLVRRVAGIRRPVSVVFDHSWTGRTEGVAVLRTPSTDCRTSPAATCVVRLRGTEICCCPTIARGPCSHTRISPSCCSCRSILRGVDPARDSRMRDLPVAGGGVRVRQVCADYTSYRFIFRECVPVHGRILFRLRGGLETAATPHR
jgi:hypothetical protein